MKLFDKLKQTFTGEKPKLLPPGSGYTDPPTVEITDEPPIEPGKVPLRRLIRALSHGFRRPARTRVYRKRKPLTRFIDGQPVVMSFGQARLHDIHTSAREAVEIRRSHRERQLEARAAT